MNVQFSTLTLFCNFHHHPSPELFHFPSLDSNSPFLLLATTILLVSVKLAILSTSCKWNHTVFVLFWLIHLALYLQGSSMLNHVSEFLSFLRLNNILLYDYIMFVYSFTLWWELGGKTSTFWLLWIMLLWTWGYKYLFKFLLSLLSGINSEVELLDHVVILRLFFEE